MLLVYTLFSVGVVMHGWHVADVALRPGTRVSAQIAVALICYVAIGAVAGGILVVVLTGRASIDRRRDRRPQPVALDVEALALAVYMGGWVFFHALDLLLVTPGERVALGTGARLLAVLLGLCCGLVGVMTAIGARQRSYDTDRAAERGSTAVG